MTSIPPLVTCEWLHDKIKAGDLGDTVIIDVSWSSTKDCFEEFKNAHIPGARHINVLDAAHTDLYPRNIPSAETFTAAARQAGINDTSHVIIYSNSDRAGFFLAGRGWWTFRLYGHNKVSILDGGLEKWTNLGYATTSDNPDVPKCVDFISACTKYRHRLQYTPGIVVIVGPGNFKAQRSDDVYKSLAEVKDSVNSAGFQVVDTRANKAFADGHIPNALNIPLADLIDHDNNQLKPVEELKKIFSDNKVDLSKPLVTHCNSGMSSCSVAFIASLIGVENEAVFHGGYTEWTKSGQSTS